MKISIIFDRIGIKPRNNTMKKNTILISILSLLLFISCGSVTTENNDDKQNSTQDQDQNEDDKIKDSPKSELLSELVGVHTLISADGVVGANTMLDYQKNAESWLASGSSIMAGERDGFDVELSEDDLNKLNTMKIIVNDDLSVILECNGEIVVEIPYSNSGLQYSLAQNTEDYIMMPEGITEATNIEGDYLYLYARDELPEDITSVIDVLQVFGDVAVIRYDMVFEKFELMLFYGECCDASSYYFVSDEQ